MREQAEKIDCTRTLQKSYLCRFSLFPNQQYNSLSEQILMSAAGLMNTVARLGLLLTMILLLSHP